MDGVVVCIHKSFWNIEIPSPFHGGAGRADKEPSHCSESIAGFKLSAYFSKVEHCGRDGYATHTSQGGSGVSAAQQSRLLYAYWALSTHIPPVRCSSMVLGSLERFSFIIYSFFFLPHNFWAQVSSSMCIPQQAVHFPVSQCTGTTGISLCLESVFKHVISAKTQSFTRV